MLAAASLEKGSTPVEDARQVVVSIRGFPLRDFHPGSRYRSSPVVSRT